MASPVLHNLTPQEVHTRLEAGEALLIDVREPGEYEAQRIPGALLFPLSAFDARYLPLDGPRQIILQCGSGVRSQKAAQQLFNNGAAEAFHMAGGIKAWAQAGLPMIVFNPGTGALQRTGGNA